MSQFPAEPFKPDGGFRPGGLLILIAAMGGAAVGLGWLASFIGQWFYLVLLFPFGIGLALIAVGNSANDFAKLRSPVLAALIGLATGALAMSSIQYFHYLRYLNARDEVLKLAPIIDKVPANLKDEKLKNLADFLNQARAADNFLTFLDMEAERGVTIGRFGGQGANLGYVGTWIYWAVELVIVAWLATTALTDQAATPFCTTCEHWKEERVLGTLSGQQTADAVSLVNGGQIRFLSEHDPTPSSGELMLTAAVCPKCESSAPIVVKLERVTWNAKGEMAKKKLAHVTYPGDALPAFEALFTSQEQNEPPDFRIERH